MDALKKKMLAELKASYGRITQDAEAAGIVRQTHYNWIKGDPEYKALADDIDEAAIDHVESKLFEKIDGVQIRRVLPMRANPLFTMCHRATRQLSSTSKRKAKNEATSNVKNLPEPKMPRL